MSDYLQPHELQHARLPCPSLSPAAGSNSCPLSQWYYLTISSSATLFSYCLHSFPASIAFILSQHQGLFPVNQLFASCSQSIGASASASVLPMNIQDWVPLRWTALISLQSRELSRVFSSTTIQKYQFFGTQPSIWFNSHVCTWLL